jgi:hypothetical protein
VNSYIETPKKTQKQKNRILGSTSYKEEARRGEIFPQAFEVKIKKKKS